MNTFELIKLMMVQQWRSQGDLFWGASSEGILGGSPPPPNFYADLDFSNGRKYNWGAVASPPLSTPLWCSEMDLIASSKSSKGKSCISLLQKMFKITGVSLK